jgi:hypothetical protein
MLLSIVASLLLFSSLSLAAAPPLLKRDPIHIPLIRRRHGHERRDGLVDLHKYAGILTNLRVKYGYGHNSSVSRRADIPLTNQVRRMSGMAQHRFITYTNKYRPQIQATLCQSVAALRKCCCSEC